MHTFPSVRREIASFRRSKKSWRQIADEYGCPTEKRNAFAACLCAIHKHNREPHRADFRQLLGLPVLAEARVCPVHGKVHDVVHLHPPKPRRASITVRRRRLAKSRGRWAAGVGIRREMR